MLQYKKAFYTLKITGIKDESKLSQSTNSAHPLYHVNKDREKRKYFVLMKYYYLIISYYIIKV